MQQLEIESLTKTIWGKKIAFALTFLLPKHIAKHIVSKPFIAHLNLTSL